jgi:hypothetical protein
VACTGVHERFVAARGPLLTLTPTLYHINAGGSQKLEAATHRG